MPVQFAVKLVLFFGFRFWLTPNAYRYTYVYMERLNMCKCEPVICKKWHVTTNALPGSYNMEYPRSVV